MIKLGGYMAGEEIPESYNNYIVPGPSNMFEKATEMVIRQNGCLVEPMYNSDFPERNSENNQD